MNETSLAQVRLGADAREVLSPSKDSDKQIWKAFCASASQRHVSCAVGYAKKAEFNVGGCFLMLVVFSIKKMGKL